ncbi:MAG TPA: NAD(+)/NADH kinase [Terriglobales bacterium]|nr:NAD(+)/NADH kinase [Terriglobales bacterium]
MSTAKKVAIISKPGKPELAAILPTLLQWLRAHEYEALIDTHTSVHLKGCKLVEREEIAAQNPTFVIVLGGDGTLLAAARALAHAKIPILGVNLGSLGFLTEVALEDLYPTLEAVHENRCGTERRTMLHCQLMRSGKCIAEYSALNDVVAGKGTIARMADFDLFMNGVFISNYKADGLILSTPTGSTAYSLASGGPILAPDVDGFVITPVSPHSLTNRPLVVRDSGQFEIVVKTTPAESYLTVDGQVGTHLRAGDRVTCKKSDDHVILLRLKNKNFFDVLRTKLKWGER